MFGLGRNKAIQHSFGQADTAVAQGGGSSRGTSAFENAPNTPPSVYDKGAKDFAEIYGSAKVESTRWFVMAIVGLLLGLGGLLTAASVLPLKEGKRSINHTLPPRA